MHHFPTLFRILSTLHPLIAIKKSSAASLLRHKLSKALPFLYRVSSSLLISSIRISANSSRHSSFSRIAKILLVFIFFATKLDVYSETTKYFSIFQDNPGIDNSWSISRNQLKEMADEKVLLVVPESHKEFFPKEYRDSLGTLSSFINMVRQKQERLPKHFVLNVKNEFNFNAPVGQFIEHADNIGGTKEEK